METKPISVYILDKEYRVACKPGEEESLFASARYLDQQMRDIRDRGRVIATDRIAVMAALNITHDFLDLKKGKEYDARTISSRIRSLQQKIGTALDDDVKLDL